MILHYEGTKTVKIMFLFMKFFKNASLKIDDLMSDYEIDGIV